MKVFLISHIADADGVTPVILSKLVFDDLEYFLLEPSEIDEYMESAINNNSLDKYDKIFVTDLCFTDRIGLMIDKLDLKNKIQVLDHHFSNLPMNKYDFVTVIDEVDGKKESGTSLYYKYLLEHFSNALLNKPFTSELVDLVRSGDTWEWKQTNRLEARDISTLLANYGNDRYIDKYLKMIRENDEFYFDDIDNTIIEIDRRKIEEYIEDAKSKVIIKEINGYRVGIIFAELYRSELGNDLAEYYKDEVDFIMIINMNRSISFRGIRDDINLGEFAHLLNGYGHKKASGAPLPDGLKEATIDYIVGQMN
jgi:oligoribonuclease NrnB/cAMP/cGMP phosphodiesterase (DHH superfamily)